MLRNITSVQFGAMQSDTASLSWAEPLHAVHSSEKKCSNSVATNPLTEEKYLQILNYEMVAKSFGSCPAGTSAFLLRIMVLIRQHHIFFIWSKQK